MIVSVLYLIMIYIILFFRGSGSYASSDNLQNEVTKLRSQIDIEKKARREAEEK